MPGFVKTPKDEARWTKAKNVASKSKSKSEKEFTDQDWGLVNHVYQNMSKFDVIKSILENVKEEILEKHRPPPKKLDEISEDGNYRAEHFNGVLHWNALPHVQKRQEQHINNSLNGYVKSHPEEHRHIVKQFIDHVMSNPMGHSTFGSEPKIRHIKNLLLNNDNANLRVISPEKLLFSMRNRHDKNNTKQTVWTFTKNGVSSPMSFRENIKKCNLYDIESILEKAKDRLNDEDSEPDAAEEWLKQHGSNVEDDERSDDAVDVDAGDQGSTDTQKSGKDTQKKVKDLDPERLKALKDLSHHWLSHADQMKKQSADARSNPHLFAEGHRQAAHNAAHSDFDEAHRNFVSSPGYQALSPVKKMRAEAQFKKEFQENNPDYHKNSVNAVAQAHGMHEKASALHGKEMNARKAHILSGGQSAGETMSASEAAQHVGAGKNDEGEYSTATVKDPAASFASQYGQHLASESKPVVEESDEYESLDNPNKKIIKHPALDDPKNKKLIEDFFKEYHPYISKAAFKARAKAVANGMPEDKIDVSGLHEAGMHGLMQAVRDYSPEVGSSFKNHAKAKMGGLMQSHLSSQDYVPRDLRSKMKAKEKGILNTPIEQPTTKDTVEAVSTAKPKIAVHDVVSSSGHPDAENIADRLKRTNTQRSVIRRPKGE